MGRNDTGGESFEKKKGGQVTLHLQLDGCRATHLADKSVG